MQLLTLITLLASIAHAVHCGRYQECPEDWTRANEKCYKFLNEHVDRDYASGTCKHRFSASLAVIDNKEENKVVEGTITLHWKQPVNVRILSTVTGTHGLVYIADTDRFQWNEDSRVKYVNWLGASRRYLKKCARIRGYDGFWVPSYCSDDSPYVCWKKTDCEPGWTGDDCNSQCHCYLGFACNGTESCPYGCELGWAGHKCDRRLDKPTVSFYCMKEKEGYSLVVSFDTKGVHFTNIGAVNAEGEVSPKCDKKTFVWLDGELRLKVQIQNTSGVWESDCPTETISKGVLKWTFRLQKKTDVVSFEDEDLQVHCDLSEADVAYDDTDRLPIENIRVRSLTSATKTRVNVRTYLANPRSLEPVTNVSLGVPVRLVVKLPEGNDVVNPLFYPWSCQAASPDGKVTVRLTDDLGCSLREDIGFGIMDKVSDVVQSEVFPLFQLPGYTEVVFTCNLVPSYKFRNETQDCSSRG